MKVPRVSRSSSSAILAQVTFVVVSAIWMSSRASQHKMTCALTNRSESQIRTSLTFRFAVTSQ